MAEIDLLAEEPEEGGGGAEWMATFADLCSLLLTFFVLLLSFANMDVVRFRVALGSVKDALGVQSKHPGDYEGVTTSIVQLSDKESTPNIMVIEEQQLLKKIREAIKKAGLEKMVEAEQTGKGVIIRIKGRILFHSGTARLAEDASVAMQAVVELAKELPYQVSVEGHTDNRPISSGSFPSNWELSTARAVAAMRYLSEAGGIETKRLGVAGYADMRPLEDNETAEGRAANRRVEFVFVRPVADSAVQDLRGTTVIDPLGVVRIGATDSAATDSAATDSAATDSAATDSAATDSAEAIRSR